MKKKNKNKYSKNDFDHEQLYKSAIEPLQKEIETLNQQIELYKVFIILPLNTIKNRRNNWKEIIRI